MGVYQRTMTKLSRTSGLRWVLSKVLTPLDVMLKGSRFAPSRFGLDLPLCFLTTTGRKTGEPRTVPLLFVTPPAGGHAIAATNFGRTSHPAWALNLETEPQAVLEVGGEINRVVAREVDAHEVLEFWPLFDGIWPGYEEYRKIAPRDIRMFVLTPLSSGT